MLAIGTNHLLLIIGAQTLILLFQLFNYLSRRREKSRLLFLYLVSSIILFNVVTYVFYASWDLSYLITKIVSYICCLIVAAFHVNYIVNDLGFQEEVSSLSNIGLGIGTSLFTSYIASHFLFGASEAARAILVALPAIITTLLCIYLNARIRDRRKELRKQGEAYMILLYASFATFIVISAIPVLIFFGYSNASIVLLNISFICLVIGYYHRLLVKNIKESIALDGTRHVLEDFPLTDRQLEVALLILNGHSYEEIADKILHLSEGTVSKHASNIFKITRCSYGKDEFIKKFRAAIQK